MERGSVAVYKAIRSYYLRRRGYVRLDPPVQSTATRTRTRTRRFGRPRVRLTRKVKIFRLFSSTKKALLRLRDGYMGMMLGFANSSVCSRGSGGEGGYFRGRDAIKEYERKVIVEIYRTVIAAANDGKIVST